MHHSSSTPSPEQQRIGNVSIRITPSATKTEYLDGAEQALFDLFAAENPESAVQAELSKPNLTWPMEYHLSPKRQFLLNWYPFQSSESLLEVGAGCGAVTGAFLNKLESITALELTDARAKVIAQRYKHANNLEVIAANVMNVDLGKTFDYVTSIGVLEYAGKYVQADQPYHAFLTQLKSFLKPGGTLVLAIENQYGMKYWSGSGEDHTGRLFDSIEGYPNPQGVQTFSKEGLASLLQEVGFSDLQWYYPFPDYKLPVEMFSDEYLPSQKHPMRLDLLPSADYGKQRGELFDERRAFLTAAENQAFPFFSNAFLVFAK